MRNQRNLHRTCSPGLSTAALLLVAGVSTGCNPFVFNDFVNQAPVQEFNVRPVTPANPYGATAISLPPDSTEDGHMLMAGDQTPVLTYLTLTVGGEAKSQFATKEKLQNMVAPVEDLDNASISGMAVVPPPQPGDEGLFVLLGISSTSEPEKARVMRLMLPDFVRTDADFLNDMSAPEILDSAATGFGRGVSAINLDGPQDEALYEVAVGSDRGVIIFDNLGANTPMYMSAREAALEDDENAFATDEDEPNGYHFTRCGDLADYNSLGAGNFLAGNAPALVVGRPGGLTLIGDTDDTNLIGAPIYDCTGTFIATPGGMSGGFGADLLTADIDDDGNDDLLVGDIDTNVVYVFFGTGDGLATTPDVTLEPGGDFGDAARNQPGEYGASIELADLGGTFGRAIVVGAPGSTVDREANTGMVFVHPISGASFDAGSTIPLFDLEPEEGSRHGLWAGGIYVDDLERQELVIMGATAGRTHATIGEGDPDFPQ